MTLTPHTKANREFFAPGSAPSRSTWCEWIERGVVRGKIIDGKPWVDANWFAASGEVLNPTNSASNDVTAMDLLAS